MKIRVIGCGNAFSNRNYNASFLLEEGDRKMLVDCGYQVGAALHAAKVDLRDITDVYVSHAHADHIGFLEGLGFQRYDWIRKPESSKLKFVNIPEALPMHLDESEYAPFLHANDKLMQELWDHSLKGGMRSIEGLDATLDTFFYTKPIKPGDHFNFGAWRCETIQQIHIMSGSYITNTFGLFMTHKTTGRKIYFTTDSQHCSPRQVEIFYKSADLIFQDCECIGVDTKAKESKFCSGVHANYAQLAGWPSANSVRLSDETKAKMLLTHYQDFVSEGKDMYGAPCDWEALAKADGLMGFVEVGDVYNTDLMWPTPKESKEDAKDNS